jgi:hypothetical protein
MPDVVEFKPVRARRPHRSVRPQLLNIKGLERRTDARKAFAALVAEIEHDLGGREQLPAIEKSLIQAYAGSAILLDDLNARVERGIVQTKRQAPPRRRLGRSDRAGAGRLLARPRRRGRPATSMGCARSTRPPPLVTANERESRSAWEANA